MTTRGRVWLGLVALAAWSVYTNKDVIGSFMISDSVALNNRNVQAFLRAIRAGESSQTDAAYGMLVYGGSFTDFSKHPNVRKPIPNSSLVTTAAGAYQITNSTYKWLSLLAGVDDFTPLSQDKMAVAYLRKLGALVDIQDGKFTSAMAKCKPVWEAITVPTLKARMVLAYNQFGGTTIA